MSHLTLIQAETEDAWYEHKTLQQLTAEAAQLVAVVQVHEFLQTSADLDLPYAA
ncbi:hypothetical protein OHA37_26930 [Streptomyces sp. NBC_00335]|uniref:hypothetical protein n=1 Tax=unclassified Streptomyces TaxID=2593676 RepID=UPI002250FA38|nr:MULTISPECIES: hypothetical protein [unclassified Streptomyces]MCX5407485.1 hypothetical protein [Streptomyces sp. NBC_00086]